MRYGFAMCFRDSTELRSPIAFSVREAWRRGLFRRLRDGEDVNPIEEQQKLAYATRAGFRVRRFRIELDEEGWNGE